MVSKILIVDDEPNILFAMSKYFRHLRYKVHCARTLEEAKAKLQKLSYELLVTDLRLGQRGRDQGFELVCLVREKSPSTRIMLLTAYGTPEIEAQASRMGVDTFLRKPKPLCEIAQIAARLLWSVRSSAAPNRSGTVKAPAGRRSSGELSRKSTSTTRSHWPRSSPVPRPADE